MEAVQLDLFEFAAMQAAIQPKVQESPKPVRPRNFQNDGLHPMPTTPAARIEANFKAIRLLKELGARTPSHEEQIKELLSDGEYQTAQNSILDSYYTPESIIDFMWDIARGELGIKSGKVAELGAGTGNFIGFAPGQNGYASDFRKHRENALSASRRPDRFARKCQTSATVRPRDRKRSIREIRPV